jgi:non-ribosomal peptide synthetase component F
VPFCKKKCRGIWFQPILHHPLLLRNFPQGQKRISEFLKEVKENALEAYNNQEYQFDDLVDRLMEQGDPSRNPLFDVAFALHNEIESAQYDQHEKYTEVIAEYEKNLYQYELKVSLFDLVLQGLEKEKNINFALQYNMKLFKRETIERFVKYFRQIITAVLADETIKLKDIEVSHDLIDTTPRVPEFTLKF